MKQYLVTEKNTWENETFNYVVELTEEQMYLLKVKIDNFGDGLITFTESNIDVQQVKDMNKKSNNSYMDFIGFYILKKDAFKNWTEFGDCFYKSNGLDMQLILEVTSNQSGGFYKAFLDGERIYKDQLKKILGDFWKNGRTLEFCLDEFIKSNPKYKLDHTEIDVS